MTPTRRLALAIVLLAAAATPPLEARDASAAPSDSGPGVIATVNGESVHQTGPAKWKSRIAEIPVVVA